MKIIDAQENNSLTGDDVKDQLMVISSKIVQELIQITPDDMSLILFEISQQIDGSIEFRFIDADFVELSEDLIEYIANYIPLAKQYTHNWQGSLYKLKYLNEQWCISELHDYRK